jgi:membrane-associated tyrosine/threonine-specific cdc2-inhibitory kinase
MNREPHAVSFRDSSALSNNSNSSPQSKNNSIDLSSSFYDRNKNESYFEQCFETIQKLGEGSFGEVFKVRCKQDGKYYAVKKMRYFHHGVHYKRERMEEVRRYEEFSDNANCVTLYKAWEQADVLFMQLELCRGSVEDYVEKVKCVSESFIWSFFLDMLLALKSLHEKNLIHLDIKLDNVLITDDKSCKLADFGLVFDLQNNERSRAIEGDARYIAPELLNGSYSLANDIFSLGITLLELATNLELPVNGKLWQELRSGNIPVDLINKLPPELSKIVISMMNPNARLRPSVDQLLQHNILRKLATERRIKNILGACVSRMQFFLT